MAGEEPGRDSKKMGEPLLEMRKRIGFRGILRCVGCPFLLTPFEVTELTIFLNSIKRPIQIGKQLSLTPSLYPLGRGEG